MTEGTYAVKVLRRLADNLETGRNQTAEERADQSRKSVEYQAKQGARMAEVRGRTDPTKIDNPLHRSILTKYQRHYPDATWGEAIDHFSRVIREFNATYPARIVAANGVTDPDDTRGAIGYYNRLMKTEGLDVRNFRVKDDDGRG